jgi:hypothetical protein
MDFQQGQIQYVIEVAGMLDILGAEIRHKEYV